MELRMMSEVINGKRYRTETALLLASDAYAEAGVQERLGRNSFLLCTPKGNYFMQHQTTWPREKDTITPLARDEALRLFEAMPRKEVEFEEAFPGIQIEEA